MEAQRNAVLCCGKLAWSYNRGILLRRLGLIVLFAAVVAQWWIGG